MVDIPSKSMWSIYNAFLNVLNWNSPHLSLIFHERPHFPKICISQDLKVNIVNARFSRNFCGRYLVDKVLCGRYLVDIRVFFWWSIFDKTPVAGLLLVGLKIINLSDEPITISQTLPTVQQHNTPHNDWLQQHNHNPWLTITIWHTVLWLTTIT